MSFDNNDAPDEKHDHHLWMFAGETILRIAEFILVIIGVRTLGHFAEIDHTAIVSFIIVCASGSFFYGYFNSFLRNEVKHPIISSDRTRGFISIALTIVVTLYISGTAGFYSGSSRVDYLLDMCSKIAPEIPNEKCLALLEKSDIE